MTETARTLLVVFRHTPYSGSLCKAGHDLALAAAAFEQAISVLLMDDGVWQLLRGQDGTSIDAKTSSRSLAAFPLYGIETFFVDAQSLLERDLSKEQLEGNTQLLEPGQLADFMDSFDQVISF